MEQQPSEAQRPECASSDTKFPSARGWYGEAESVLVLGCGICFCKFDNDSKRDTQMMIWQLSFN